MIQKEPKERQTEGIAKRVRGPQAGGRQKRLEGSAAILPLPERENAQGRAPCTGVGHPGKATTLDFGGSPATARAKIRSKSHLDYWRERIKRPRYTRAGVVKSSPHWAIELQLGGKRCNWSLGTSNRDAAAVLAREIYLHLQRHGWEATRARYRPTPEKKSNLTIGEYLEAVRAVASQSPRTLESYAKALRKITADAFAVRTAAGQSKFDYLGSGNQSWKTRVESVRLAKLTPASIQSWKLAFIARAGSDPLKIRRARNSVNSFLRRAKSLFSTELLSHLRDLELPKPLPFEGVTFEPRQSNKYYSTIDVPALIGLARKELATKEPEAFKIFLLGLFCGLRRHEIDLLEWNAFRWNESALRIAPTKYFQPKSEESIGSIPIEPELLAVFRGFKAKSESPFVINSDIAPRPGSLYSHYRCTKHFDWLTEWLRTHGVDNGKPLHTLRKEFGSQICANLGIYAASRALRHSAIAITADFYTDAGAKGTVGLGHLLADRGEKIIPIEEKTGRRKRRRA
jgi:integrase